MQRHLFKWGSLPSLARCADVMGSLSHMCRASALHCRTRVYKRITTCFAAWGSFQASQQWVIHLEKSTASPLSMVALFDCSDEWQRAVDEMSVGTRPKRQDCFASSL